MLSLNLAQYKVLYCFRKQHSAINNRNQTKPYIKTKKDCFLLEISPYFVLQIICLSCLLGELNEIYGELHSFYGIIY